MSPSGSQPASLVIVGAGVSGCALVARLLQLGWGGTISLVEAGRGAGGRCASRPSRLDSSWRLDHGAPFLSLEAADAPALLAPLLAADRLRPWPADGEGTTALRLLQADGSLREGPGHFAASGRLYRGWPSMANLAEGLLSLAEQARAEDGAAAGAPAVQRLHGRRVGSLERQDALWMLRDEAGEPLAQGAWLVLSGTLLAHPRCRELLGWREVPLQAANRRLQDKRLEKALEAVARLRYDPRLALLLRLDADQAGPWRALPFLHLELSVEARRRWGLERISVQPLPDGRCGVVAHARPEDLRACGLLAQSAATDRREAADRAGIEAMSTAVLQSLSAWIAAIDLPPAGSRQLMRWGGAFPQHPGLEAEAMVCPASQVALCGDATAGVGFGRIEGAWRSGEWLAARLLPELTPLQP